MNTFSLIKRFSSYYKPYKYTFAADIFCCLAVIGVDLSFPMIVRHILNDGLSSSGLDLSVILSSSALLLILRIFDLFFNYYSRLCHYKRCTIIIPGPLLPSPGWPALSNPTPSPLPLRPNTA